MKKLAGISLKKYMFHVNFPISIYTSACTDQEIDQYDQFLIMTSPHPDHMNIEIVISDKGTIVQLIYLSPERFFRDKNI